MTREQKWQAAERRWEAQARRTEHIKRCIASVALLAVAVPLSLASGIGDGLVVMAPLAIANMVWRG